MSKQDQLSINARASATLAGSQNFRASGNILELPDPNFHENQNRSSLGHAP